MRVPLQGCSRLSRARGDPTDVSGCGGAGGTIESPAQAFREQLHLRLQPVFQVPTRRLSRSFPKPKSSACYLLARDFNVTFVAIVSLHICNPQLMRTDREIIEPRFALAAHRCRRVEFGAVANVFPGEADLHAALQIPDFPQPLRGNKDLLPRQPVARVHHQTAHDPEFRSEEHTSEL